MFISTESLNVRTTLIIESCTIAISICLNVAHKYVNLFIVWQRLCEPSPDLGFPFVHVWPTVLSGIDLSIYWPKRYMLCQTLPTASQFVFIYLFKCYDFFLIHFSWSFCCIKLYIVLICQDFATFYLLWLAFNRPPLHDIPPMTYINPDYIELCLSNVMVDSSLENEAFGKWWNLFCCGQPGTYHPTQIVNIWQRFCEPRPDPGIASVSLCVCVYSWLCTISIRPGSYFADFTLL